MLDLDRIEESRMRMSGVPSVFVNHVRKIRYISRLTGTPALNAESANSTVTPRAGGANPEVAARLRVAAA